jgi:guanylate kinase
VRRALPGCKTIFILPPARSALEQRLRERRTDSAATIARRLADASADMSHYREFDFLVVNDQFEQACRELGEILDGGGAALRATRPELEPLIKSLLRQQR